ncbi:MAG: hypothetical protein LKE53_11700 [Oscillospiraceae bacterium]|nr:hypothetical protein [Oscillospiraceae bacterium]
MRHKCSALYGRFSNQNWALESAPETSPKIIIGEETASIQNGKLCVEINFAGVLTFYKDGKQILRECFRNYGGTLSKESSCLKIISRQFRPVIGSDDYELFVEQPFRGARFLWQELYRIVR